MTNIDTQQMLNTLLARIQKLEEKDAITTMLHDYCRACDTHDFETFGNKFTEDGVLHFKEWGEVKGPKAITEATRVEGAIEGLQHSITNLRITLTSDTTASATAYLIFYAAPVTSKPFECYAFGGPYEFEFHKTAEGWKILRHALSRSWAMGRDPLANEAHQ